MKAAGLKEYLFVIEDVHKVVCSAYPGGAEYVNHKRYRRKLIIDSIVRPAIEKEEVGWLINLQHEINMTRRSSKGTSKRLSGRSSKSVSNRVSNDRLSLESHSPEAMYRDYLAQRANKNNAVLDFHGAPISAQLSEATLGKLLVIDKVPLVLCKGIALSDKTSVSNLYDGIKAASRSHDGAKHVLLSSSPLVEIYDPSGDGAFHVVKLASLNHGKGKF